MRPTRTIQSTWLAMLVLQTVGTVDTRRRLPAPRQFVAISALWGMLYLMADTGLGKMAARLSILVLITASVVGPFGARFVTFLATIAKQFAAADPASSVEPAGPIPGAESVGPAPSVSPWNP